MCKFGGGDHRPLRQNLHRSSASWTPCEMLMWLSNIAHVDHNAVSVIMEALQGFYCKAAKRPVDFVIETDHKLFIRNNIQVWDVSADWVADRLWICKGGLDSNKIQSKVKWWGSPCYGNSTLVTRGEHEVNFAGLFLFACRMCFNCCRPLLWLLLVSKL